MKNLSRLDATVLAVLIPGWVICFGLTLRSTVLEPTVFSAIFVRSEAGGYPTIVSFTPFVDVAAHGPRLGDQLIRVGERDQRGTHAFRLFLDLAEASHEGLAEVLYEREGIRRVAQVPGVELSMLRGGLPVSAAFFVVGVAILLRAPRSRIARAVFRAFVAMAFVPGAVFSGPRALTATSVFVFTAGTMLVGPLIVRALQLFPHGVPPRGRWAHLVPYPFVAIGIANTNMIVGIAPGPAAIALGSLTQAGSIIAMLLMLHGIYHRSGPDDRCKLKWILVGLGASASPFALAQVWAALHPSGYFVVFAAELLLAAVPVFIYVGLYRADVFDVDRALSMTASYNIVVIAFMVFGELFVPQAADAAAAWLGLATDSGQLALSLSLALLVVPAERFVRPRVAQLLFGDGQQGADRGLQVERLPSLEARRGSALVAQLGGYARLSSDLGTEGVSSLLERAITSIREVVHVAGGTVVEVSADRVLACFDASGAAQRSERSALCAAHDIFAALDAIREAPLAATIGIATGDSAVDLAERIEALTRDFACRILVDGATLAGVPESDRGEFELYEQIFVAGYDELIDLAAWDPTRRAP